MTTPAAAPPAPGSRYPRMSYEEFLRLPDERHMEWVDGVVLDMAEISTLHAEVTAFLGHLIRSWVEEHDLGKVYHDPFNMKLPGRPSGRSPDVTFIAAAHADRIRPNHLEGPADLVIEVISPGSASTDRGVKFEEYEAGGVPEYWIIDPAREIADFFVLGDRGVYQRVEPVNGVYESRQLEGFRLKVEWLWQRPKVRDIERELGLR